MVDCWSWLGVEGRLLQSSHVQRCWSFASRCRWAARLVDFELVHVRCICAVEVLGPFIRSVGLHNLRSATVWKIFCSQYSGLLGDRCCFHNACWTTSRQRHRLCFLYKFRVCCWITHVMSRSDQSIQGSLRIAFVVCWRRPSAIHQILVGHVLIGHSVKSCSSGGGSVILHYVGYHQRFF